MIKFINNSNNNLSCLIFVYVFFLHFLNGCGGRSIYYDKSYEKLNKTVIFSEKMYYLQNIIPQIIDTESAKYNRDLINDHQDFLGKNNFIDNIKIKLPVKNGMCFKVVKSFEVIPWGLQKEFSSRYRMLVLEDEDGLLSTTSE